MGEKEQGDAGERPGKPSKEQRIAAGDEGAPAGIAVSDPGVPNDKK
jgi:hypothetical protein